MSTRRERTEAARKVGLHAHTHFWPGDRPDVLAFLKVAHERLSKDPSLILVDTETFDPDRNMISRDLFIADGTTRKQVEGKDTGLNFSHPCPPNFPPGSFECPDE